MSGNTKSLVVLPLAVDKYREWIKENINETDCVEFTATFKDKIEQAPAATIKDLVKGTLKNIIKCRRARALARVILIAELSDTGRFHYHGILCGMTKVMLRDIRHTFNIYFGRTEIKQIQYYESYIEYILKDLSTDTVKDREYDITLIQTKKPKSVKIPDYSGQLTPQEEKEEFLKEWAQYDGGTYSDH